MASTTRFQQAAAVAACGLSLVSTSCFVSAQTCDPQLHWLPAEGDAGLGGVVSSIAAFPNGDIVAGGGITNTGAGTVMLGNIGLWSEASGAWSPLGSGIIGVVNAVLSLPDGDIIAAGAFGTAGGTPVQNIARWDSQTQSWSALGAGITVGGPNAGVYALALLQSGEIVAAGTFTSAGGAPANNIARWDPVTQTWSAMGSGMNLGPVTSLATLPNGDLVAGGIFSSAGGVSASRIARWTPASSAWSALGSGISKPSGLPIVVAVAALPDGDVVAGGDFTLAGGSPANRIARWDAATSTWSALGSGMNQRVTAVCGLANGDIVAGGAFTLAGGAPASHVAVWSTAGNAWSELFGGTSGEVFALTRTTGPNIAAGGDFSTAGSNFSFGWARTTFSAPSPTITTQPQPVSHCAGQYTGFFVTAYGAAPRTYQWRKDTVPIDTGVNPTAAASSLVLENLQIGDAGSYDCVITNTCGTTTSLPATLAVAANCCDSTDFNNDGLFPDTSDIDDFLSVFSGGPCSNDPFCSDIDFNNDALFPDTTDIDSLLSVFSGGPCL